MHWDPKFRLTDSKFHREFGSTPSRAPVPGRRVIHIHFFGIGGSEVSLPEYYSKSSFIFRFIVPETHSTHFLVANYNSGSFYQTKAVFRLV